MRLVAFVLALVLAGCAPRVPTPDGAPPSLVLGGFEDDYGSTYTITEAMWHHTGYARYHIRRWRSSPDGGYLIAQNDDDNPTDGGRWTRIDWVRLEDLAPYAWAFCLSTYDAPSFDAAESMHVAQTDTPRTGCNGFPFSRMRRVAA